MRLVIFMVGGVEVKVKVFCILLEGVVGHP